MSVSATLAGAHARVTAQNWAPTIDRITPPVEQPPRIVASTKPEVTVEVVGAARLADIQADWRDLVARADVPNIFMHPLIVALGACYPGSRYATLLAWGNDNGSRRLMGFWAFSVGRARRSIIPLSVLTSPPSAHAFQAAPVIDRDLLDVTLEAMLEHIADDPNLPKIIALDAIPEDGATMQALNRVLAARASVPTILRRSLRPMLSTKRDGKRYLEEALSTSSRKKLRQHRRRLAENGALKSRIISEPQAIVRAVEDFLRLEAAGWKGRKRTALLCNPPDATFTREMMATLAPRGEAWIHALTLDERPISMQIVLRAGAAAFTWKTAYDEALRDYSPGMLLLEDYTIALLGDSSIAYVDSCCYDDTGYMAVWRERQATVELWIDARRGGSAAFAHLSRLQDIYLRLRAQAKAAYRAGLRRRA